MKHSKEFLEMVEEARGKVSELTIEDLLRRREAGERFRLIDVREDHEWAEGHLPGAEHLGRGILERDVVACVPDKAEALVLYCGGGFRSVLAAESLQRMGYRSVLSLAGGWRRWCELGLPTAER